MTEIKQILVGVDFSECSMAALLEAMRLGTKHKANVRGIHIIDAQIAFEMEMLLPDMRTGIRDGLIEHARQSWKHLVSVHPAAASTPIDFVVAHRIEELLRRVEMTGADLLVLGAQGVSRPDVGTGSMVTACVQNSRCDVLVVRDTHLGTYKTVVVGVDFSEVGNRAVERAAQIAEADRARLFLFHALSAPWDRLHPKFPAPFGDPKFREQHRSLIRHRMNETAEAARARRPALEVAYEISESSRHRSKVVDFAMQVGADLVCVGTRGHSNLRDNLLGSTAERVLVGSSCSVLAVRPGTK